MRVYDLNYNKKMPLTNPTVLILADIKLEELRNKILGSLKLHELGVDYLSYHALDAFLEETIKGAELAIIEDTESPRQNPVPIASAQLYLLNSDGEFYEVSIGGNRNNDKKTILKMGLKACPRIKVGYYSEETKLLSDDLDRTETIINIKCGRGLPEMVFKGENVEERSRRLRELLREASNLTS